MSPRVTVAIRTKNRPLLLARALDSVRGQTMTDLELVVVNDAGELAPVERLMKERLEGAPFTVRLIDNPVSAGREAAMNLGFQGSSADYLVLHDDDDAWAPEFLERTVAYLDSHPDDGAVATRTAVVFERLEGERVVEESREILASDRSHVLLSDIAHANFVPPISLLFRRDVYEEIGPFDGRLPVLADWEFTLRLLALKPIGFLDGEPLAFWHQRKAATGDHGNSVFVAADDHSQYASLIRDEKLRESAGQHGQLGMLLYLTEEFRRLEESLLRAELVEGHETRQATAAFRLDQAKALDSVRVQLETAIGRLEGRQVGS